MGTFIDAGWLPEDDPYYSRGWTVRVGRRTRPGSPTPSAECGEETSNPPVPTPEGPLPSRTSSTSSSCDVEGVDQG